MTLSTGDYDLRDFGLRNAQEDASDHGNIVPTYRITLARH